jgi:hypothetical protein
MKKLLLLLLIAPILMFSQDLDFNKAYSITSRVFVLETNENYDELFSVPNNEVWYVKFFNNSFNGLDFDFKQIDQDGDTHYQYRGSMESDYYTGGETLEVLRGGSTSQIKFRYMIYKFKINSQAVLASVSSEIIENKFNSPTLYPNPTSSLLALNSDKEYDIEVYDMAGNKVMALTGNTIDMSHLSSATYIVKALDKLENEEVSYKVVKN